MEVTVRLVEGEPTVAVQVLWHGAELNLNRAHEEPVERFLQRLGLSCSKYAGRQTGGDRKRAKKERKKPGAVPGQEDVIAVPSQSHGLAVGLVDSERVRIPDGTKVADALAKASHVDIEGELLPILVNPPSIVKFEAYGKPLAGCPLVASVRCDFCEARELQFRWLRQVAAGNDLIGHCIGEGRILWIPEDMAGQSLTVCAEPGRSTASSEGGVGRSTRMKKILRLGAVEEVPPGWPERRLGTFGPRIPPELRVVTFNILAAFYSKTQVAAKSMYPYCPPSALDFAYRQPLIGRELRRINGDVICLQECSFSTYRKFLLPLFGDQYHVRMTLKASKVSEGCVLLLSKASFEVLEDKDFIFRKLLRGDKVFRPILSEVAAKWPDFLSGVLPHMTTIFQLSAVRHTATGKVLVIANTHLFFHPQARHIRLLQTICLLQKIQEMREQHRVQGDTELPHVVLCGDLNSAPETAAVKLLLEGGIPCDHPDWEHASQFAWRDEEESAAPATAAEDEDGASAATWSSAPSLDADPGDNVELLPRDQWQPGRGVLWKNPLGPMLNTYADAPLAFTNYVHGYKGILDWILTAGSFRVVRSLGDVTEEDLLPRGGLPNIQYPSDHLSVAADLVFA
eukprot:CAMPEP_0172666488 /NCGR_PEP_ID=MMETSP1074-20121228/7826_1 /TAXON_ID=2916 /ORGANISM="Ceratium fusus, Strain PA161109" /LENGTH=624 /DNA_ID=CAMNT_0013482865 /DNA_START=17 /DNA_END=1891 /DNA_ORIENTATION=+